MESIAKWDESGGMGREARLSPRSPTSPWSREIGKPKPHRWLTRMTRIWKSV